MRLFHLSGHIGASVSALVDGQLSAADEDRAWAHVLTCPGCRRLVEAEGWTKTRLRTLSAPAVPDAPQRLRGSLYDIDAWARVDRLERASTRRRTAAAVVGVGSVGAAVLGIVVVTTPPAGRGEVPGRPSPAMIRSDLGSSVGAGLGVGLRGGHGSGVEQADVRSAAGRRTAR